jgi:elongation factor 2
MLYVSKMIPTHEPGRFYAFGRVFSGTVRDGQRVRVMGANFVPGFQDDLHIVNIRRTVLMMARKVEDLEYCACGNTVGLVGIDQYLVKSGTISTHDSAYPIKAMKFSVAPVVRVAVQPKNPADLQKLIDGLGRLAKSDPCVQVSHEETGEHIIAGAGDLHLEICLKDLQDDFAKIPINQSPPVVSFRETVTALSHIVCLSKSQNKLNRLQFQALPLGNSLVESIESKEITPRMDMKARGKELQNRFGWDQTESRRVWSFGPDNEGPNLLVDMTKSAEYLQEAKEHLVAAFQWATRSGVLCNEPLRGVRFNIVDVVLHSDASHRNSGQITPAGRRALYASQLTAKPSLIEPVYLCELTTPLEASGAVYGVLSKRLGRAVDQQQREGTPLIVIKAYLPVMSSFGFDKELRLATSGQAFPQMIFDHWEEMEGDAWDDGSRVCETIAGVRKRKGLDQGIPDLSRFIDRL